MESFLDDWIKNHPKIIQTKDENYNTEIFKKKNLLDVKSFHLFGNIGLMNRLLEKIFKKFKKNTSKYHLIVEGFFIFFIKNFLKNFLKTKKKKLLYPKINFIFFYF